ncbi:MAG: hypothetical protein VX777_08975 [Chlamydiota bacterium]|nr:hypothetical protein [Chlamydiota bacterium]
MSYNVNIEAKGQTVFTSNQQEVYQAVKNCAKSKGKVCPFVATLIPVRTNNGKNFAKDFFLPTVVNQVPRIHNVAGKIFAGLGAFVLDLITLPVRLLTCVPRVFANSKAKDHALHKLLVEKGVDPKKIDVDTLKVSLKGEVKQGLIEVAADGCDQVSIDSVTDSYDVNLVTQPAKKLEKSAPEKNFLENRNFEEDYLPDDVGDTPHKNLRQLKDIENFSFDRVFDLAKSVDQAKIIVKVKEKNKTTPFSVVVRPKSGETLSLTKEAIQKAIKTCCKKAYDGYDCAKDDLEILGELYISYIRDEEGEEEEAIFELGYGGMYSWMSEASERARVNNEYYSKMVGNEGPFIVDR